MIYVTDYGAIVAACVLKAIRPSARRAQETFGRLFAIINWKCLTYY